MAIATSTLIAGAALAATAYSVTEQRKQGKRAERAQRELQKEEKARNKAQEMAERRKQIREERIKRARVLQSAQNTGTAFSSGETGAVSSLNTQLGANLGFNASMVRSGERMSVFSQDIATAQRRQGEAAMFGNLALQGASFAGSIFSGSIGGTTGQPGSTYDANKVNLLDINR